MRKYIIYLLLFVPFIAYGQISTGEKPYSWNTPSKTLKSVSITPTVTMPNLNMAAIQAEDEQDKLEGKLFRFGYAHTVSLSLENSGTWETAADGGRLWKLNIYSPDAISLNLLYDKFWLPEGAKFYIYSSDKANVIGAFTAFNNKGTKDKPESFATALVKGNNIVLEYYEPKDVRGGIISVNQVISGYKDLFNSSAQSLLQQTRAASSIDDEWNNEKNATTLVLSGNRVFTGVLVNNTAQDNIPYVVLPLGLGEGSASSSAIFYWNFNDDLSTAKVTQGAFFVDWAMISGLTDLLIYKLKEDPADRHDITPYYLGWDCTRTSGIGGVDISFFNYNKKISPYSTTPIASEYGIPKKNGAHWSVPSLADIYTEENNEYIRKGSLLINSNHHLIGLYDLLVCSTDGNHINGPIYTRFDQLFGNRESTTLKNIYLDPLNKIPTSGGKINGIGRICKDKYIQNQAITTSQIISGCNIEISGTTITNKATVMINAEGTVIVNPNFIAGEGTTIIITAKEKSNTPTIKNAKATADAAIVSSIEIEAANNQAIQLGQNAPNPFSDVAKIRYVVPENTKSAYIAIYDTQGRVIKNIAIQNKGEGEVILNASEFNTGVYIYSLHVDGVRVDSKRFVINK